MAAKRHVLAQLVIVCRALSFIERTPARTDWLTILVHVDLVGSTQYIPVLPNSWYSLLYRGTNTDC